MKSLHQIIIFDIYPWFTFNKFNKTKLLVPGWAVVIDYQEPANISFLFEAAGAMGKYFKNSLNEA